MTTRWRRGLALTVCTAGAASVLAACASGPAAGHGGTSGPAGSGRDHTGPPRFGPVAGPATGAPGSAQPGAATGLLPAPAGITDRLTVPRTRLRAGQPLRVTLLVTYTGSRRLNLNRGCRPQWAAVLTNHQFPPDAAFASVCSARPFIIRSGQNMLRTTVVTTYQGCTMASGQPTRQLPRCGPHHRPPALPAGRYRLVLVGDQLPLPAPAPIPVTLTRAACPPGARCPALDDPARH